MDNFDIPAGQGMAIQEQKPNRRLWIWACSGCLLLLCLVLGVGGFILFSGTDESYPLQGEVAFPPAVQKGDDFYLVLTLSNAQTESVFIKHFTLQKYVGLPSLLDAATIISVEPHMESEPIAEKELQYAYFQEIKPGETVTVTFHMQAEKIGTYYIDVGVYARHPSLPDPAFISAFWFGPGEIEVTP
jgi:hypothetical protein